MRKELGKLYINFFRSVPKSLSYPYRILPFRAWFYILQLQKRASLLSISLPARKLAIRINNPRQIYPFATCISRCGRSQQSVPEYICVIITARSSRARAIMRVIVWLTKRPGQNDGCVLLFDRRARAIGRYTRSRTRRLRYPLTVIRIARNVNGQLVKRAIQRQSAEREGRRERAKGEEGYGRREISIAIIISRERLARSLVNAPSSCRFVPKRKSRAKRVSNDRSLFPCCFLFSFFCVFFSHFFLIPRDDGIYRALAPRTSRRARSVVNNEWAFYCRRPSRVYFLRFHRTSPWLQSVRYSKAARYIGLPFFAAKKRMPCGL